MTEITKGSLLRPASASSPATHKYIPAGLCDPDNTVLLGGIVADKIHSILPDVSPDVYPPTGVYSTANLVGGGPDHLKRQHRVTAQGQGVLGQLW